jgi:hypothetical protein
LEGDLSRVPEPLAEFRQGQRQKVTPWASQPSALALPSAPIALAPPELELTRTTPTEGGRVIEARLRSARGARMVSVGFAPTARISSVLVNGESLPERTERIRGRSNGWRLISCVTDSTEGCVLQVTQEGHEPIEAFLYDESPGLPLGKFSRPAVPGDFVPSQSGDVTIVTRTVKL